MTLAIRKAAPSGLSVYTVLRRSGDEYRWIVGNGFEAFNAANLDSYDVPLTDSGGDDYATDLAFTAGVGRYVAAFYIRAGSAPANDDFKLPGEEVYDWTGTALAGDVYYTTTTNLYEYGQLNTLITANLSSSGLFEDSPGIIIDAVAEAYGQSNVILASANPRPDTFPVVSSFAWVNDIITRANTIIAWGALLNRRDDQGGSRDANGMTGGDRMMQKGLQMLRDLIATTGGIPGVGEVVEEERAGSFEFATIVRDVCTTTGDENSRPLLWY